MPSTPYGCARIWYFNAVGSVPTAATLNALLGDLAVEYGAGRSLRFNVGHLRAIYRELAGVPAPRFSENGVLRLIYQYFAGSAAGMPGSTAGLYCAIARLADPIVPPEPGEFGAAEYIVLFSRGV